jgi:IS30 family transposase
VKKKFKQLSQEQRYQIGALLEAGKNKSEIADIIGVHRCTISRELRRNIGKRGQHAGTYVPRLAQTKTMVRHKVKNKFIKLIHPPQRGAKRFNLIPNATSDS